MAWSSGLDMEGERVADASLGGPSKIPSLSTTFAVDKGIWEGPACFEGVRVGCGDRDVGKGSVIVFGWKVSKWSSEWR